MEEKNELRYNELVNDIKSIIETSKNNAVRSVDFCRVQMYWGIGRRIFEDEQKGEDRAEYGSYLLTRLASEFEPEYGSGFRSVSSKEPDSSINSIRMRPHCGRN